MLIETSVTGVAVVVIVIVILILVSIQFTLNQILRELREIRKKVERRDTYRNDNPYKGSAWDE